MIRRSQSILLGEGKDTTILVQADYLKDRRLTDCGIPAINGKVVDVPRSTYYGAANAKDMAAISNGRAIIAYRILEIDTAFARERKQGPQTPGGLAI